MGSNVRFTRRRQRPRRHSSEGADRSRHRRSLSAV